MNLMDVQSVMDVSSQVHEASTTTWHWIGSGLSMAVSVMAVYIAKTSQQERQDRKEEREAMRRDQAVMLDLIRENTTAFVELRGCVAALQRTLDTYIHQER